MKRVAREGPGSDEGGSMVGAGSMSNVDNVTSMYRLACRGLVGN